MSHNGDSIEVGRNQESAWTKLRADLHRAYSLTSGSRSRKLIELLFAPGIRAVIIFRFSEWMESGSRFRRKLLFPFYFFFSRRMSKLWGITIQDGAQIEGGFMVWHFGGIFIGTGARIGRNVGISHDVTIGTGGKGRTRGLPTIGDNVYVSPGVVIAGKIRVGNNVKISPNCFVDMNIPDNSFVHPEKPRVVRFPSFEHEESVPLWDGHDRGEGHSLIVHANEQKSDSQQ